MNSSTGELLYVKGMDNPGSLESEEDSDVDIWDDSKLKEAYDKGVMMANVEIAKRLAMATNKGGKESLTSKSQEKAHKPIQGHTSKNCPPQSIWKAGMACRAIYDCDGLEYEAFVLRIVNDKECVVRFLGYENSELVSLATLKPSRGKEARARQIEEAYEPIDASPERGEKMELDSERTSPSIVSPDSRRSKKKHHRKPKTVPLSTETPFSIPNMPNFQLPTMNGIPNFMNLSSMNPPIPPPPTTLPAPSAVSEDAAISSMLLSWYMSGYTTGYYQGLRKAKEIRNKKD